MITPVSKTRPRLLLLLATTLLCGAFTGCDEDHHQTRHTSHGYHDNDRRHHDDRRGDDYRRDAGRSDYRRDTRSTYDDGGAGSTSVTIRRDAPVVRRSVSY